MNHKIEIFYPRGESALPDTTAVNAFLEGKKVVKILNAPFDRSDHGRIFRTFVIIVHYEE